MLALVYILFFYVVLGLVFGWVTSVVGQRNGWSSGVAFALGFVLGIIGLLIVALVKGGNASPDEDDALRRQWEAMVRWQGTQPQPSGLGAGPLPVATTGAAYIPCPECGNSIPYRAKHCPKCQTDLSTCEECGGVIPLDEMTCRYCGLEYYDDDIEDELGRPKRPA